MTLIVMIAIAALVMYTVMMSVLGHIPKKGRSMDADSGEIFACITNNIGSADRYSILRAKDESGKKYSVKLRPTEAKLWIKGDKIKITFTEDGKNYRIHFHEYFKKNEDRIREKALERLEKNVKFNSIAAKMTEYTKESLEALRASKADSRSIFAFESYMRYINKYFIIGILSALVIVPFAITEGLERFHLLVPLLILVALFLSVSSTAKVCKKIYKNSINKE